jgi:ABC-type bacteriocin/lantibiotic exporter with double-glycine peptidase domain
MRRSSNLLRFIAIPFLLVIVVTSVVLFSVAFAILLIPMAIIGFKFWRMIRLAQKQQNVDVIEAQYTVIEKRDDIVQ